MAHSTGVGVGLGQATSLLVAAERPLPISWDLVGVLNKLARFQATELTLTLCEIGLHRYHHASSQP